MRGRRQGLGWHVGETRDKQQDTAANTPQPLTTTTTGLRLRLVSSALSTFSIPDEHR